MITRRPDISMQMDMHAIGRVVWKAFANSVGTSLGGQLFKKVDVHAAEGDKVAAVTATAMMVGGGALMAVGQHILTQVLPNMPLEEKEETDAE